MNNNEPMNDNSARVFPLTGTRFYNMVYNKNTKKRYFKWFKRLNRIVVPLYKIRLLPLFGFGFKLIILTTKGRITGKKRNNPVEFFRINGIVTIVSAWGEKANWCKNILAHPDEVYVQVGFRSFHARVEFLEGSELEDFYRWLVTKHPTYSKEFGWDSKIDDPDNADLSLLMKVTKGFRLHKPNVS